MTVCVCVFPQTLHTECTVYTTAHKFPGILRWFEVVDTEVVSERISFCCRDGGEEVCVVGGGGGRGARCVGGWGGKVCGCGRLGEERKFGA